MPTGSFAKDTLTSDKWELDIFILFNNVTDKWIYDRAEDVLTSCLRGKIPFIAKYAQHPYITALFMGLEADIVPAIKTSKPREKGLGVERTPFHTIYVASKLDNCQRDEVRLLKAFLKGLGIYGAEVKVQGFSGYLAELLIIKYGSFHDLLIAASKWRPPVYIDLEGNGDKNRLLSKYRNSPMIVVDPVDPERNAAAAVSMKSLATFVIAAKLYNEKPSIEFFYPFAKSATGMRAPIYVVSIVCDGEYSVEPPENTWGRARRAAKDLAGLFSSSDFEVTYYSYYTDEYRILRIDIGLVEIELPLYSISVGPDAWTNKDNIIKYIKKRLNKGEIYWIDESGRLSSLKKRKFTKAKDLIEYWVIKRKDNILKNTRKCTVYIETCREATINEICYPVREWMRL